jgi:hypothetical protein
MQHIRARRLRRGVAQPLPLAPGEKVITVPRIA